MKSDRMRLAGGLVVTLGAADRLALVTADCHVPAVGAMPAGDVELFTQSVGAVVVVLDLPLTDLPHRATASG